MVPVSIVIIARNKADILARNIANARLITDDIVVIDSDGSAVNEGDTPGLRILKKEWDGYGANKNKGVEAAKYDWILSIDADELADDELVASLHQLKYDDAGIVYDIKFRSYFGGKQIRFGSWGRDHHIRLFNRKQVRWSETIVHETLILRPGITVKKIDGHMNHFSVNNAAEYERKGSYYARLSARKYFDNGRKSTITKLYLSPIFGFIKNYIFFLGFLDGREGWDIAKITVKNTWRKYHYLSQLEASPQKKQAYKDSFAIEY
ncbi:glycosyltransferase family 2 protein [Mucilaginibacter sp. X4EP1]|uniref:glycosyltransferase family 2 protein n=1 Tax=Mucilaginibacter sp. X4EP1 TaxID=2723092 RepID=UPI002166C3BE|nr:glycosyltransferase family 2 protein [Mucilaginibacter sp. X4EP1]MCS3814073.1 glycosyltransferase involved in cell wall biosynthesis [Mucilaginibacter sp. X4EP1]